MIFVLDEERKYLVLLYKQLFKVYSLYQERLITQEEYLSRIKPIDHAIEEQELAILEKYFHLEKPSGQDL